MRRHGYPEPSIAWDGHQGESGLDALISPRDVVTISKTLVDNNTLIDISTSLPRSRNEPPYLRPSPPYVRAHVSILGWCIQVAAGKAKLTCMWSWDPKGAWAVGGGVPQHLPSVMVGMVDYTREGSERVPVLQHFGQDISIGSITCDPARGSMSVGYVIVSDQGKIEFAMSQVPGWEVQVHSKDQSWLASVGQTGGKLVLRISHLPLAEELVRYRVTIESTSAFQGVRVNGTVATIEPLDPPVPKRPLLEGTSSVSLRTFSTIESETAKSPRNLAVEKSIASLVRRNYIYFTSLLQEPEPKWRPVMDTKGVAVHQLNSIDKTLVVFRAEAVLVGVGIWDLFAIISNPATRQLWDRTHDESQLLDDVNELTDLWLFKSKAAWPVAPRDSVMLRTTYKSPSSVHIFGFSTDDADLFPRIPPSIDPTVIRTQIDLQGWSIESLSPNTTQVTLLEQSDPRGWSNKSSIPQVMMSTLAGIGESAIKHGAPPVATRLGGAKATLAKYDVDKATYRIDYERDDARQNDSSSTSTAFPLPIALKSDDGSLRSLPVRKPLGNMECEIRCDADKWGNNVNLLIDPPHCGISALKRHRLSPSGGGLWLTIEHPPDESKVSIVITKNAASIKTAVTANGQKVKVDIEDLSEADVHVLKRQKRAKPTRIPLDQPPALGTLRKRQSALDVGAKVDHKPPAPAYSRLALPLTRLYNVAAETTRAAIVPMAIPAPAPAAGATPIDAAVRALSQLTRMHADRESESTDPFGWQAVSDRDGLKIEKRIVSHVSDTFPVYRAGRIIEGFTAEEVSAAISAFKGDERFEKPLRLQSYGHGITVQQLTALTTFPFRARSILAAGIVAKAPDGPPPSPSTTSHSPLTTLFHASSSAFDPATVDADAAKYNPTALPPGNMLLEGWIIETIDPYSHEQYAIPSTRCMYVGAIDYSGNMPLSVNNMLNASLPRSIINIEQRLKYLGPPHHVRLPPMGVMLPDTTAQGPWSVEADDKVGVDERSDIDYTMIVTVQPSASRDELLSPMRHNDSRSSMQSAKTIVDMGEEIRRGRKEFTVMEVEIGTIASGCDIMLRAVPLPMAQNLSSDQLLPLTLPTQDLDLPYKCTVLTIAPVLLDTAAKHLLRITLPTTGYEPVDDPLQQKSPLPRPRWLLDLINDGAVVELRLKTRLEGPVKYTYNGTPIPVEDDKRHRPVKPRLPALVSRDGSSGISLDKPIAVAREYMISLPPVVHAEPRPSISSEVAPIEPPATAPVETKSFWSPLEPKYNFWKYRQRTPISASPAQPIVPLAPEQEPISVSAPAIPMVPLPAVIIMCLVCLLLGSLMRSLVVESDFVVHLPAGVAVPTGFKELRRVMQWRIWPGRDVVIAVARH